MTYVDPPPTPSEPPPGSVVRWQARFGPQTAAYDFVGLHVAGRGWYVTGRRDQTVSFAEIVYWPYREGPVYVATSWGMVA